MKARLTALCMAISAVVFSAFKAEDDPFLALIKKLEAFTKKYPTEKIHLHLDKPYYAVGDNIWLKAYITDSRTSAPTALSKAVYVELIDEKDSLRRQLKLPVQSGISWGDFALADTLPEGNYRIRAYTQLMRNAGSEFFFDKPLKIGNSWSNKVFTNTQFAFTKEGNTEKVNTTITFSDKAGKPYVNQEVNYTVELSARIVGKGKVFTGKNGEIYIPVVNTQPALYKSGRITAKLTLSDKEIITKIIPLTTTAVDPDVQFFPESGNLVTGLPGKIAFKSVNAQGKGENISGRIVDNEGVEITNFESSHLGMGSFYLNPMANKTYRASVKFKNGTEKWFNLPKAEASGYVLNVNNTDSTKVALKVLISDDLIGKGNLHLLAQQNGSVYFSVKIPTTKNIATTTFPKTELPSGIITLTLFNSGLVPVSERLIYIDNTLDKIQLTAENLKKSYGKRSPMALSFNGTSAGKPTRASFSVAVTNATRVQPEPEEETNIFSSLLLKSELKGNIEKPNYYFLGNDTKRRADLDHLLLTQGWRKINWKMLMSNVWPDPVYPPETALKISGRVITNSGKPVPNGKISLFSSSGGLFATDTLTDANGRFSFDMLQFPDSSRFVVQAKNEKGKRDVNIELDQLGSALVTKSINAGEVEVNINDRLKNYLQASEAFFNEQTRRGMLNRTIQLKKVDIIGEKKNNMNSANLNGAGRADAIITAKDLENAVRLSFYLSGRIAGITVREGKAYSRQSRSPMRIVLDGVPFDDMDLDDININDIETVEVLKGIGTTAIYGTGGINGVLVITTKTGAGTSTTTSYAPGVITHSPKGYNISREFYSPKYNTNPDPRPDLRTTVYWNPAILSDENGKFTLNYFNTDEAGTYRMVIEGIDALGRLTRSIFTYEVN